MGRRSAAGFALASFLMLAFARAWASITGSISGVVTDPSGAVLSGATVVATETQTGVKTSVITDGKGFYNLPALAVGTCDIDIRHAGFKTFRKTGLVIGANSALRVDAAMNVGTVNEQIEVKSEAAPVDTQSTQMGEVIEGSKMTSVPLNGRNFIDLLALQPGVSPHSAEHSMTRSMSPVTLTMAAHSS
jgi:Carboxypeptidase regulatory-like domain